MIYTHVLNRGPCGVRSPADLRWSARRGEKRFISGNEKSAITADSVAQNDCITMDLVVALISHGQHGQQSKTPRISDEAQARASQRGRPPPDAWTCVDHSSVMHSQPKGRLWQNPAPAREPPITMGNQPCLGGEPSHFRSGSRNRPYCSWAAMRSNCAPNSAIIEFLGARPSGWERYEATAACCARHV
jgi:hypothetical protein